VTSFLCKVTPTLQTDHDFGLDNLIVSGCSFTNYESTVPTKWPSYLANLGNFKNLYNCGFPGAGNYHVAQALKWCIELHRPDPVTSLVVVMWSGMDRDDAILAEHAIDSAHPWKFRFAPEVHSGITAGLSQYAWSNSNWFFFRDIGKLKSPQSRAVENFLYIIGLKRYLDGLGYDSVFVNYLDPDVPHRGKDFDIRPFLPDVCCSTLAEVMDPIIDPYHFCLQRGLLGEDDFHPSPDGHLAWTREHLIPYLKTKL
jgi:hypothetical protein